MASDLYGTILPGVSDSAASRVISEPADGGGLATGLQNLARGLSAISGAWDDRSQRKRQDAALARQTAQDARQARLDAQGQTDRLDKQESDVLASDVTVGINLVNGNRLGDTFQSQPDQAPPTDPRVVNDVTVAAKQIKTTETAVDQGRLPAISRQAQVDTLFNRLLVKYPNKAHEIAKQFKELGVESALFDELKNEIDDSTAAVKAQREENTKLDNIARENMDPKVYGAMSPEERQAFGAKYQQNENAQKALAQQATIQSTMNADTRAQTADDRQTLDRQWGVLADQQVMTVLNPLAQRMQKTLLALGKPGADPKLEQDYAELITLAKTTVANVVNAQISRGGYADQATADAARKSLTDRAYALIVAPYESRSKEFAAAADLFTKRLGFDHTVSAPVISQLTKFGIGISDIPELIQSLDPKVLSGLKTELAGIGRPGITENRATVHMMNVVSVFKGEKNLSSIDTPAERQAVVSSSFNYVVNNSAKVAQGNGNGDIWMNTTRQLVMAAGGFSNQTDTSTLATAGRAMFDGNTVAAVNKLKGSAATSEEASVLGQGLRAAAAVSLASIQQKFKGNGPGSPYTIVYNRDTDQYAAVPNPKWKAPNKAAVPGFKVNEVGPQYGTRPGIPKEIADLVGVGNRSLSFLAATASWDADAPKGTTREVKRYWALNQPTSAMQSKTGGSGNDGNPSEMIRSLRKDLSNAPNLIEAPYTDNSDIIGPEGTGKNPRSSAIGVGQFTDDTWVTTLSRHAPDSIKGMSKAEIVRLKTTNPDLAHQAVGWYRADNAKELSSAGIQPTASNTALAHFAGASGAVALLKSDPNEPAINVLGPRAINANPHLKGKTAGEVIAWARRFYKA